jgi:hypothetical protein
MKIFNCSSSNGKSWAILLSNGLNNYADAKRDSKEYTSWNELLAKLAEKSGIVKYSKPEDINRMLDCHLKCKMHSIHSDTTAESCFSDGNQANNSES